MAEGKTVILDGQEVRDFNSFADQIEELLGFPGWWGRNWAALDDLLFFMDRDRETTSFFVDPGHILTLRIEHAEVMRTQAPDIFDGLVRSIAFVNWGRVEQGMTPFLCLAFYK